MVPAAGFIQQREHLAGSLQVQVAGGFIRENDVRLVRQRPSDRDALLFAPGEFLGKPAAVVFQAKLALDGVKDLLLINLSVVAIVIDMISGGGRRPRRFYAVVRLGQRFDRWLRLHSAKGFGTSGDGGRHPEYIRGSEEADTSRGRMLGSDADTLIDRMEDFVRRQSQPGDEWQAESDRDPGGPGRNPDHGRGPRDYDRDLEEFDRDLKSRDR